VKTDYYLDKYLGTTVSFLYKVNNVDTIPVKKRIFIGDDMDEDINENYENCELSYHQKLKYFFKPDHTIQITLKQLYYNKKVDFDELDTERNNDLWNFLEATDNKLTIKLPLIASTNVNKIDFFKNKNKFKYNEMFNIENNINIFTIFEKILENQESITQISDFKNNYDIESMKTSLKLCIEAALKQAQALPPAPPAAPPAAPAPPAALATSAERAAAARRNRLDLIQGNDNLLNFNEMSEALKKPDQLNDDLETKRKKILKQVSELTTLPAAPPVVQPAGGAKGSKRKQKIYTGSKGGKYILKKGKKVYIK
jgi:hypothetical protein